MKKFFLYFLFFLLIAGLAVLAYGFWNAKNIRRWTASAVELKMKHEADKGKKIEEGLNASGGKKAGEFNRDLAGFVAELDAISKDMESAKAETERKKAPRSVRPVREHLTDFFQKRKEEIDSVGSVARYMSKVFEVAVIFDTMNPETTAQEIRDKIAEGKQKSGEIDIEILPEELRNPGNNLKVAVENYLDQFDQFAAGKIESHDQLNASYSDFSQNLNSFLAEKKKYFDSLPDTSALDKRIDEELALLARVRFSVK